MKQTESHSRIQNQNMLDMRLLWQWLCKVLSSRMSCHIIQEKSTDNLEASSSRLKSRPIKKQVAGMQNCLHLASFLLFLLSDHKDGGSVLLWNDGTFLLDYMANGKCQT
jgi:hypothetical protein